MYNLNIRVSLWQAIHLCRYIKMTELPDVDFVADILKELDRQIEAMQRGNKFSHKSTKVVGNVN